MNYLWWVEFRRPAEARWNRMADTITSEEEEARAAYRKACDDEARHAENTGSPAGYRENHCRLCRMPYEVLESTE